MKTLVTNTSGARRFFGYVGRHGTTLDADEAVTVDGDLRSDLASGHGRYARPTEIAALDEDCANGDVTLAEVAEDCSSSSSA